MAKKQAIELHELHQWRKVEAPAYWSPTEVGEELCGFFINKSTRSGQYGDYEVVLVAVPGRGAFVITGTRLVQLVDASGVTPGQPVRIVWQGLQSLGYDGEGNKRTLKLYDFYVADGEPLSAAELPSIRPVKNRAKR